MHRFGLIIAFGAALAATVDRGLARGADEDAGRAYNPTVAPASDEGAQAIRKFRPAEGLKVELFAAEPLLANPVAFHVDTKGRFYVAETFRHHAGVTDNRDHMVWLEDELAARTVADRVEVYRRYLGDAFETYKVESERIRLVEDTDGDGQADRATVFAEGFNQVPDGIGAGVLARDGEVYFTCIPKLWKLKDTDNDGKADVRDVLHDGYGVHTAFLGHDLHGLIFGPDGKLYFSMGDRGLNVTTKDGRQVVCPDTGAILRCEPDGSDLEIVATGLRNPQELAFDQYGNLFSCDNNSDSGDKARWVYLVEGGDSGWRIGYQYLEKPVSRGPWNAEKLWSPHFEGQAAYIVPPILNISDGPSGLAYDPGTGLPDRYRGHFFLCDFRGTSGQSGIRSFAVRPKGASFEVVDSTQFLWSVLATDVDFGPDGGLYLTDWVEGWVKPGKGRIYRVTDPQAIDSAAVKEVRTLLAEGAEGRPVDELVALLRHADMRVRQMAQFALAGTEKGGPAIEALAGVARADMSQLARLHAIWGLGQIGRRNPEALRPLPALLGDTDPEVRSQAARVLGDNRVAGALDPLVGLLGDESARVRFFAAMALGRIRRPEAVGPVLQMLRDNAGRDPYLRHAGVMALAGSADAEALAMASADPSADARMGALLAYRRREDPAIARFLEDPEPLLVVEAARAINDVPIEGAMDRLARLAAPAGASEDLLRRVVNANLRAGTPANARNLAALAARADLPASIRAEALGALAAWPKPPALDRVVGLHRPLAPRPAEAAAQALTPALAGLLAPGADLPAEVQAQAAKAAGSLAIADAAPALAALVRAGTAPAEARLEALRALEALDHDGLGEAARLAYATGAPELRRESLRIVGRLDPDQAIALLTDVLAGPSINEKQGALATLATVKHPEAERLLLGLFDDLLLGRLPAELELDVLEAAKARGTDALIGRLARYQTSLPLDDPLASYKASLAGGDRRRGRRIFAENLAVACLRCHKAEGQGGEVGPDLDGLAAKVDRRYLLESIVAPNNKIAEGFETQVVAMADGTVHTGILRGDDGKVLRLITPEGKPLELPKSEIEEQKRGDSAMPADILQKLSRSDLRDLVEYLASLTRPRRRVDTPL